MELDVAAAERVEGELDRITERRSASQEEANRVEERWAASEKLGRDRRRDAHRREWCAFHRHMEALHASLCEEHRAKAARLSGERTA